MPIAYESAIGILVRVVESIGAAVIAISIIIVVWYYIRGLFPDTPMPTFLATRRRLGQGLVLGLEFFIGADIIRTVTTTFNLENVLILGAIIVLRTILSFSLEYELREAQKTERTGEGVLQPEKPGGPAEPPAME
jgi:uncharacterized membrane protein